MVDKYEGNALYTIMMLLIVIAFITITTFCVLVFESKLNIGQIPSINTEISSIHQRLDTDLAQVYNQGGNDMLESIFLEVQQTGKIVITHDGGNITLVQDR